MRPAPRSIPACAGEPEEADFSSGRHGVYPRVCGGTRGLPLQPVPRVGLSPRVRGNRGVSVLAGRLSGSIPACAGEPSGFLPRAHGAQGLSPRVRGNRHKRRRPRGRCRSIPACAGEPSVAGRQLQMTTVYPRVCGGTPQIRAIATGRQGLSPRVRGNHTEVQVCQDCARSIPACAGEPQILPCSS